MRVAYLVSQYPAPSHTFIRREIRALRDQGVGIEVFSIRRPLAAEIMSDEDRRDRDESFYVLPPDPWTLVRSNVRLFAASPRRYLSALMASLRHRNPGLRNLLYALFYFLEGIIVAEQIQERGVGHLHCHFANSASHVALVAATYTGVTWSLTLHGLCDFDYPAGPLLGAKLASASFAACATHFGHAQAMRLAAPGDWSKLFVARCGLQLERLPTRAPRAAGQPLRIICVGRLAPEKGQRGLLTAFARAVRRGLDARLVLVGDGPDRASTEAQVAELALGEHVEMLGRLPEDKTLQEIARSDVLVLASFMEGLPVVLMEALALEVPVVAPQVAGIPELVVHGETGLLFAPGHWDELAERLLQVAADPEGRTRMAARGRERVRAEFEIRVATEPLRARFLEASAPGSSRPPPSSPRRRSRPPRGPRQRQRRAPRAPPLRYPGGRCAGAGSDSSPRRRSSPATTRPGSASWRRT